MNRFLTVFLNYFDNPGGSIPTWLVNWAAKVSARFFLHSFFPAVNPNITQTFAASEPRACLEA